MNNFIWQKKITKFRFNNVRFFFSFLATAVFCATKLDTSSKLDDVKVSEDVIIRHAIEICDILQFEFIFTKPCEQLDYALSDVIDKFKCYEILSTEEVSMRLK